jgi:hypothetical protein
VATDLLRVVVVSREPVPVTTVLRFKLPGCLPVSVPSVEEVAPKLRPDGIVLLDLGDGGASLDAARKLRRAGIQHGIVVIGTAGTGGLAGVSGLQPPFQLTDLGAAMEQAREHSARATSAEGGGGAPRSADEVEVAPETPPSDSTAPTSASPAPPSPPARPMSTPPERAPTSSPAGSRSTGDDTTAPETAPEAPAPAASAQPRTPAPVRRGPSTAVPQVALEAVTSADESLFTGKAPTHPGGTPAHGGAAAEPLRSKVDRWRKRLAAPAAEEPSKPSELELHERLVQIFAATSQIESIAAELPIVTDRAALYQAIVMAVADEFTADTVVLWRRAHNGWVAAAHRGLTGREASLPVGFDQPVLHDVDAQTGAILLDPTPSFQNLISGIGGAHTESFMASAIAVGSNRLGILAVGRDEQLVEADLDRLVEMAVEAAVGMGVAEHIERMSSLVGRMGGGRQTQRAPEPGHWREEFLDELSAAWHARREGDDAADPANAAGMWSALAGPGGAARGGAAPGDAAPGGAAAGDAVPGDAEAAGDDGPGPGPAGAAGGGEPETVIDLTSRTTKRA